MTLPLILDLVVILLLMATIVYAVILNRKLKTLHEGKEELRHFLETFAESLAQAKTGVEYLKQVSLESSKDLQDKIRQAKGIRDELGFFVENGEKTIGHLEKNLQTSRVALEKLKMVASVALSPSPKPSVAEQISVGEKRREAVPPVSDPPPLRSVAKTGSPRVEPRLVQALRGLR